MSSSSSASSDSPNLFAVKRGRRRILLCAGSSESEDSVELVSGEDKEFGRGDRAGAAGACGRAAGLGDVERRFTEA